MDLGIKSGITDPERWLISSELQAMLLDELYIQTGWGGTDGVFHGGTALHFVWDSPRQSEDLDFMVAEQNLDTLAKAANRIVERVRLRALEHFPGSVLEFKSKDRGPGAVDRLVTWDVRWRHENRMGKVQVKLEFYATTPECLADYASFSEMRLPGVRNVRMRAEIQVPHLVSFWGDKVKAMSTRPEFKFRDAFDLGFISRVWERNGNRPSPADLAQALVASARIYGKSLEDLESGLDDRLSDGSFERLDEFKTNMSLWFAPETHASMSSNGTLAEMLARAKDEAAKGLEIVRLPAAPGLAIP
jgi:hypothetical protein